MGAGQKYLRTALLGTHIVDICADAVALAQAFTGQGLIPAYDGLGPAQVNQDVTIFYPFDDTVYHFTDAVLVFLVLPFPFRFAHLLNDYLLGSLSGYATEINWWQGFGNEVANAGIRIATQGLLQRNFRGGVLHNFDHFQ